MTDTVKPAAGGTVNALLRVVNIFLVAGLALAVVIFFLLVPAKDRTSVSWLNLGVGLFLFFLNMITFQWFVFKGGREPGTIASASIQGAIVWFYDLAAAGTIVASMFVKPENAFALFLSIQLVLVFLVLFGLAATLVLDRFIVTIDGNERRGSASLDEIKSISARLEPAVGRLPAEFDAAKKGFHSLKDDLRYLAPNPADEAIRLESEIRSMLLDLEAKLAAPEAASIGALTTSLAELVAQRKAQRQ